MKANTRKIMESHYDSDDMNLCSQTQSGPLYSGMPYDKHLKSKHSRRAVNRRLKNKWRKEVKKQAEEEIKETE